MPKVTDIKQYWSELAKKAGIDEDTTKLLLEAMDKDTVKKAFTDGFKPLPDYSHDLDNVKKKTQEEKDNEYKDWHEKEKVKFNEYVRVVDEHKKYTDTFGPLDNPNPNPNPNPNNGGGTNMLSKEEIDRLLEAKLEERLSARDAAYLSFRDADYDHMKRFNRPVDRVAFEKAWKEHPEWGGNLYGAYEKFISPEVEKARELEIEARVKAAREEGIRDGYSRRATPTDHQPRTFSPMFDRKPEVDKLSESEQERHSREAFFEGLREKTTP